MGEPKFSRPKYDTPSHSWKADRIEEEHAIQGNHGLKNMKEIWKAKSQLRRHRRQAMRPDYDYVFNKVRSFQNSYDKKVLDESIIGNLLLKNNLEGKIDNLKISSVDGLIYVSFSSSNINDAVSVSEKLINGSLNEISSISYQRSNNKINTQLIFD